MKRSVQYDLVQLLANWDGIPSHYPQTHARHTDRRRRAVCGQLLPVDVSVIHVPGDCALFDQVSCLRCRRALARNGDAR